MDKQKVVINAILLVGMIVFTILYLSTKSDIDLSKFSIVYVIAIITAIMVPILVKMNEKKK